MSLINSVINDPFLGFGGSSGNMVGFPSGWNSNMSSLYPSRGRGMSSMMPTRRIVGGVNDTWVMNVDVCDGDKEYIILCEVPGVSKDKLNINIENNILMIRCEKRQMDLPTNFHYDLSEIDYGRDTRRFNLPANVNQDSAEVCLKDGLLCIKFQKMETHGPKKLEIKM